MWSALCEAALFANVQLFDLSFQVQLPRGYGHVFFKNKSDAVKAQLHLHEVCISGILQKIVMAEY
jgi:hypothetical protein